MKIFISSILLIQMFIPAWADSVYLKSGKSFKGKILPRAGLEILVRTKEGLITVNPSEILSVYYDEQPFQADPAALGLYRERSAQIGHDDIPSRFELAQFCLNAGLYEEAAREFRALIPYLTGQTEELEQLIRRSEEAAFNRLLSQASWWGRVAHQEAKALSLIESARTQYPDYAQKVSLKEVLYQIQKEMESRMNRERIKRKCVLWASPNFKVYASSLFKAQAIGEICEDIRSEICKGLKLSSGQAWKTACEVFIFEDQTEYLEVSGAQDWSGGSSLIVFELDENSIPVIYSRTIMVYLAPRPGLAEASRGGQDAKRVLAHEIAHLLFQDLLGATSSIPTWISEGFAMYVLSDEWAPVESSSSPRLSRLVSDESERGRVKAGEPIPLGALTQMKAYPPFERAFYEQSEVWVSFLIKKGGMEKFLALAYLLGTGASLEAALVEVYPERFKAIKKMAEELGKSY